MRAYCFRLLVGRVMAGVWQYMPLTVRGQVSDNCHLLRAASGILGASQSQDGYGNRGNLFHQ